MFTDFSWMHFSPLPASIRLGILLLLNCETNVQPSAERSYKECDVSSVMLFRDVEINDMFEHRPSQNEKSVLSRSIRGQLLVCLMQRYEDKNFLSCLRVANGQHQNDLSMEVDCLQVGWVMLPQLCTSLLQT